MLTLKIVLCFWIFWIFLSGGSLHLCYRCVSLNPLEMSLEGERCAVAGVRLEGGGLAATGVRTRGVEGGQLLADNCSMSRSCCAAASNSSSVKSIASFISSRVVWMKSSSQIRPRPCSRSTFPTRSLALPAPICCPCLALSPGLVGTDRDIPLMTPTSPSALLMLYSAATISQFDWSHLHCIVLEVFII